MKNSMMTIEAASEKIRAGAVLVVAGSVEALKQLPKGNWIGGSSYYFMAEDGGRVDRENVFVTEIDAAKNSKTVAISADNLPDLAKRPFANGFSVVLIPAFSEAHVDFAVHGSTYENIFDQPLMGWIAGVHLDEIGQVPPTVFNGADGAAHEADVCVLHVELADDVAPDIDIVNLFEQDKSSDTITFGGTGFKACEAYVNGEKVDFAAYVEDNDIDTALPLVANYAGAMINVSFQNVDRENGVDFYAPVIEGVEYHIAKSPGDYASEFAARNVGFDGKELSCNCILNYVYGELEGKTTGNVTGPATFGEIAYILLNQTQVNLKLLAAEGNTEIAA